MTGAANLTTLADLSGAWIDRVHEGRPRISIVLDMDSNVSQAHGTQEGSAYSGHFACTRAYSQANFLRALALPEDVKQWSLTTLRDRPVKIGTRIVRHGRSIISR